MSLSGIEFDQLLADRGRCSADQYIAVRRFIRADRLACLSAACRNWPTLTDEGVDYYLWSLQISGLGTLLTGVNFVTTILKMRAPGMSYLRMPMFCWTSLASMLFVVAAFPILTATFLMLTLDRYAGMHFFTNDMGGNPMMYINLIWAWGHPEVYILILPAFGIFSEVVC